jgi:hypothetical protein
MLRIDLLRTCHGDPGRRVVPPSAVKLIDDRSEDAQAHVHPEPVLHEECERHLLLNALARRDVETVAEEHATGDVFQLQVGQVVAQANPRAGVERHEPVRVVGLELGAVGRQPPLGVGAEKME